MDREGGAKKLTHAFILSWERPLYLWACLDSFYRATRSPCRFVLADNASRDPLIQKVIDGFERRGMFHAVHRCATNDPRRFEKMIAEHWDDIGDYLVFIESDTVVVEREACWLASLTAYMEADPSIGAIGSRIDPSDFVSEKQARQAFPDLSGEDLEFLIKARSPERRAVHGPGPLSSPHNPPMRLLLMRKSAYAQVGFAIDSVTHRRLIQAGWRSLIATEVVHRHLSLLNIFDYPESDRAGRDRFFHP